MFVASHQINKSFLINMPLFRLQNVLFFLLPFLCDDVAVFVSTFLIWCAYIEPESIVLLFLEIP